MRGFSAFAELLVYATKMPLSLQSLMSLPFHISRHLLLCCPRTCIVALHPVSFPFNVKLYVLSTLLLITITSFSHTYLHAVFIAFYCNYGFFSSNKLLYKWWALSMGRGNFNPNTKNLWTGHFEAKFKKHIEGPRDVLNMTKIRLWLRLRIGSWKQICHQNSCVRKLKKRRSATFICAAWFWNG